MKEKEKPWKISKRYFLSKIKVLINRNESKGKTMENLKTLFFYQKQQQF